MRYCDLHCHSVFSDGTCTPAQLVDLACQAGLDAIALTDHNTVDGIEDFLRAAEGKIEACAGCEFTTEDNGRELHLLGLFLDSADLTAIRSEIEEQLKRKEKRNRRTIENLAEAGYDLSYEEFVAFAGTGVKNRVHIARYMMEKGIVSGISEAFGGLLASGGGFYQEVRKPDFCRMISLISKAGGLSVWAHPLFHVDRAACGQILRKAKDSGLDGVEVYYSTYTEDDTDFMIELSRRYRLLQSGGSDFHGDNKPDIHIGFGRGNLRIPYELYQKMKDYLNAKRKPGY